jgi:hypothetical protein
MYGDTGLCGLKQEGIPLVQKVPTHEDGKTSYDAFWDRGK